MYLQLHRLTIHLDSEDTAVNQEWQRLFAGWLVTNPPQVDIHMQINLVDELPPVPASAPIFTDSRPLPDDIGVLSVYTAEPGVVWLHYHDGALVQTPLATTESRSTIRGIAMSSALTYGRFEDITFTSLAPALRRQGYYLVHAFAAAKDGTAVLIVGASGSGKTTSGLSLLLGGWRLLANDILLLESRADGLYALPTPGGVSIRPATFDLLPALKKWLNPQNGQVSLSGQQLSQGQWAEPSRAALVLLPEIEATRPCSQLQPANRAVALVHLLEESADRWDTAVLDAHVDVMEQLSRQTAVYHLLLGQDVAHLPELIEGVRKGNA
ncbi:MAG TPA: hypothetical protein PLD25_06535 [Chloroflexota bacterium]|nr:hypothetical protein [Chloroflexota bacterium]HUM71266.1 hypothetical protein [Chloroflexota bacterium]